MGSGQTTAAPPPVGRTRPGLGQRSCDGARERGPVAVALGHRPSGVPPEDLEEELVEEGAQDEDGSREGVRPGVDHPAEPRDFRGSSLRERVNDYSRIFVGFAEKLVVPTI